jgi:hypothetical protein
MVRKDSLPPKQVNKITGLLGELVIRTVQHVNFTIIGFAMQNVLEVKNVTLPQSILRCLSSEMAQMKPI